MAFRKFLGVFIGIIGTACLLSNSYLLGNGALKWAHEHDPLERLALATGGGAVPWLLAVTPMLFALVTISASWKSKLSQGFFLTILWVIFFAYNFMMGTSNIAKLREDKVAEHGAAVERLDITRERRSQLRDKLKGLPQHRPSGTVSAEIEAVKISKPFTASDNCTNATTKAQRETCQTYERLNGEFATAEEAERLEAELTKLEETITTAPAVAGGGADPFVDGAAEFTGWQPGTIRLIMSMSTPVVLEVIGASCWKYAVLLLGWKIRNIEDDHAPSPKKGGSTPEEPAPRIPPKDGLSRPMEASLGIITRQRSICENFFKNCTRHSRDGHLPEREWFEHYTAICERSHDNPLPIESFRRIAATYVPSIQQLDGVTYYSGVLPLVRNDA